MTHIDTPGHLQAGTRPTIILSAHAGVIPAYSGVTLTPHNGTWVWDNKLSNPTTYTLAPMHYDTNLHRQGNGV